jgi:hypothetical protein
MTASALVRKWETARDDLGIEIAAPYDLEVQPGVTIRADLLVRDFGGRPGTLVVTEYSRVRSHLNTLEELGYGFSVLTAARSYDRSEFIDMLSDWGWTGEAARKPSWVEDQG